MKEQIKLQNRKESYEREDWIKTILRLIEKAKEKRQNATSSN